MPFTFSHPAKKLRLSATGLIVGSMTPDFEYFIRMKDVSRYSHTLPGLLWFDLPVGVLLCSIYHLVVRNSLFDNLPVFFKERFMVYKRFNWIQYLSRNWIIVCIAVLIGAVSHLLWDAFTHETLFIVQKEPELSEFMKLGGINLASYKFLQLSSSVLGLSAIIVVLVSLKKHPVDNKKIDYRYWTLNAIIFLTVLFMRFVTGLNIHNNRRVLVAVISSITIALILTPMILAQQEQIRRERFQQDAS
jgi:hypothetical protein